MTNEIQLVQFADGPFLNTAVICELVLEEKDGVKSAIKIYDRITHSLLSPTPQQQMPAFDRELSMLLRFKSGSARGSFELQIRMQKPSGESPEPAIRAVNFEGDDDRGIDIVVKMNVRFEIPGLYWFDVYLDQIRITRIPMRVVYLPQVMQTGRSPEGQ